MKILKFRRARPAASCAAYAPCVARAPGMAAAALLVLSLSSCWQPTFSAPLSASETTASKMSRVSTITVAGMKEYRSEPGLFLPRRVATPTDGIWLHGQGLEGYEFESTSVWYLYDSLIIDLRNDWAPGFSADPTGWPIARMSPAPAPSPVPTAGFPLEAAAVARKDASWGAAWLYEPAEPPGSIQVNNDSPILPGMTRLIGAGFATDGEATDSMLMVYIDETSQEWFSTELSLPLVPPVSLMPHAMTRPGSIDAAELAGVGFAARKGTSYYLSVTDKSGTTSAFRWQGSLEAVSEKLAGITDPLVAVLNGETPEAPVLLASDGMTMTAHAGDGTPLYSFPAGSLRFVHERLDTTGETPRWMAVFCRTMFVRDQEDDSGTFRAEVFEIAVRDLAELAE